MNSKLSIFFLLALSISLTLSQRPPTPGRQKSECIIRVPSNASITQADSNTTTITFVNGTSYTVPSCPTSSKRFYDNGWIASVWASSTNQWTYVSASWTVPPAPAKYTGQTIFFFPGTEDDGGKAILQPVLQYGVSGGGGGEYWSVGSWYVDTTANNYVSPLHKVNPGDKILGTISFNQVNKEWTVTCYVNSVSVATISVFNIAPQNHAMMAMEVYAVESCNKYPANNLLQFQDIKMKSNFVDSSPSWSPVIFENNCRNDAYCSGPTCSITYNPQTCGTTACNVGDGCCDGKCFGTSLYDCVVDTSGSTLLCPKGFAGCYKECYDPKVARCDFGGPKPLTSTSSVAAPSATSPPPTAASTVCGQCGTLSCCATQGGLQCYSPNTYICSTDNNGAKLLCPLGTESCNKACFDPTIYSCTPTGIVVKPKDSVQSSTPRSTTTVASLTTKAPTSSSSTTAKSTTVKSTSSPAISTSSTIKTSSTLKSSTVLPSSSTPAATCASCGAAACCYSATGTQCYSPQTYICGPDNKGKVILCPKSTTPCNGGCIETARYQCTANGPVPK
eukprot:TRINITY_DN230_c0_g1_i1.p1 TRINITY_DN230_c0_g1~~TRINITY_DN230_c0_g1_i1.p1  ORF type:complete len:625 (-),score=105.52 TRINITY_DN230_c0_g1_i1:38-1720(-)